MAKGRIQIYSVAVLLLLYVFRRTGTFSASESSRVPFSGWIGHNTIRSPKSISNTIPGREYGSRKGFFGSKAPHSVVLQTKPSPALDDFYPIGNFRGSISDLFFPEETLMNGDLFDKTDGTLGWIPNSCPEVLERINFLGLPREQLSMNDKCNRRPSATIRSDFLSRRRIDSLVSVTSFDIVPFFIDESE